jgi:hypothetical protein
VKLTKFVIERKKFRPEARPVNSHHVYKYRKYTRPDRFFANVFADAFAILASFTESMIQARGNRILQCNFTCANLIASITYSSISIDIAKNRKSSRMSLRQHNYRDFGMTVIGRNANIILSAIARRSRRSLPPNFPP